MLKSEIIYNLECCILGAILTDVDAMPQVAFLRPECFNDENNQRIYESCLEMYRSNEPIDLVTLSANIYRKKEINETLSFFYISQLMNHIANIANVKNHGMKLAEFYFEKVLSETGLQISNDLMWSDALTIYNTTDNKIREIISELKSSDYTTASDVLHDLIKKMDTPSQTGLTGVPSGFTNLDRITSGFQKTDLIVLAARPGMGKTAMMLTWTRNAVNYGHKVGVFSHEMSSEQLMRRLISLECEIPLDRVMRNQVSEYQRAIMGKVSKLQAENILLDDSSAGSFIDLKTKVKKMKYEKGIDLVIVDYLQMMRAVENKKNSTRDAEMGEITNGLKAIAKEFDLPIIALSQLSRKVEERSDKKPILSDLRDSGNIEQAADIVMMLYRPEYYGKERDEFDNSAKGLSELIIAKNRNGSMGSINLMFKPEYTKFEDYDGELNHTTFKRF